MSSVLITGGNGMLGRALTAPLIEAGYAEQIIKESGVPYTILRAPQFYQLVEMVLKALTKPPIGVIPKGFRHQPMDMNEVAEHMVDLVREIMGNY